jgi:hypothetical protein
VVTPDECLFAQAVQAARDIKSLSLIQDQPIPEAVKYLMHQVDHLGRLSPEPQDVEVLYPHSLERE